MYQGWTNWETWNFKLWIDNDAGSYEYWQERTERAIREADSIEGTDGAIEKLRAELDAHLEETAPNEQGFFGDVIGHAVNAVDTGEIAASMVHEHKEPA